MAGIEELSDIELLALFDDLRCCASGADLHGQACEEPGRWVFGEATGHNHVRCDAHLHTEHGEYGPPRPAARMCRKQQEWAR